MPAIACETPVRFHRNHRTAPSGRFFVIPRPQIFTGLARNRPPGRSHTGSLQNFTLRRKPRRH
nr:MAG TPA: hypothetical protein [Caudoviricetes sp.]